MKGRAVVASVAVGIAMGLGVGSLQAQGVDDFAWGARAGFAVSPDAFFLGVHGNMPIENVEGLSFEPVLQIGFGSESVISYNTYELGGRARYDVESSGDLSPFLLAGIGIYRFSIDEVETPIGGFSASTSDVGLQLGGGVEKNGFGVEAVLGISGVSDVQIAGRYTFYE